LASAVDVNDQAGHGGGRNMRLPVPRYHLRILSTAADKTVLLSVGLGTMV
jgi:hypothetical protein